MLVLTRKINETVVIGDNVRMYVLAVNGCQVRLGFDAPKNLPINRKEIYDKIQDELSKRETENVN